MPKFTNTATSDACVAALGPKCFVMTSIHKNESQLTTIPQSSAIKLNGKLILLFAKRFIVMTETIKSVIVSEGILRSNTLTSLTSVLILFIFYPPVFLKMVGKQNIFVQTI